MSPLHNRFDRPGKQSSPMARPPHDLVAFELDMIRFYHRIFSVEIRWNPDLNMHFLHTVKNAYCKWTIQNRLSAICFDHPGMRCAYIFLNTPCFSSTVAFHFHNMLRNNPSLLQTTLSRGTLSLCCLGGGPAPELVAILKVFEIVLKFFRLRFQKAISLTVRATIVDIEPGWQAIARWMTQNWWKHFDTSIVKLKVSFVRADLTHSMGAEVREAVGSSDFVTMVKFLSAVFGTSGRDKIPVMLQEITDCMPVGSVLFFMNCPRFNCFQAQSDVIAAGGHMKAIYGPVRGVYRLSDLAMDECFRFYYRYYGGEPPTPENKSDVTAWYKENDRTIST